MGNLSDILFKRRELALSAVRARLDAEPAFTLLSAENDPSEKWSPVIWQTEIEVSGFKWTIIISLGEKFPDELPSVYLPDWKEIFLKNPHVLKGGSVCVFPDSAAINIEDPVAIIFHVVEHVGDILKGVGDVDFQKEFSYYWGRTLSDDAKKVWLIDPVDLLGRPFPAAFRSGIVCIASTPERLNGWVSNYLRKESDFDVEETGIVVRLNAPLLPKDYPRTLMDLMLLVNNDDPDAEKFITQHILHSRVKGVVLLAQVEGDGYALSAVIIEGLNLSCSKSKELTKGFRVGHVPDHLLLARAKTLLQTNPVERSRVVCLDHQRIHSRGGDGKDLSTKSALVIGCGSLGGYVAHLLARAGVGIITLTDNDVLGWENLGRHILGAQQVDKNKARALAEELSAQLPHLKIESISKDWRDALADNANLFAEHDIVVSTTADWKCERPLNELTRIVRMPPVLLGWLEPFAVAGHCLVVSTEGGCFECSSNEHGRFLHSVADFDDVTLLREPGGCAHYQRYGPSALMPVASMISSVAIEMLLSPASSSFLTTWVSSDEHFSSVGAELSEKWKRSVMMEGYSKIYKRIWGKANACRFCGGAGQ